MKMPIGLSITLALLIAGLVQSQGIADPVQDMPKEVRTLDAFMRRKLDLSREAIQGIVTEDFPLIKKSAEGLEKMSRQAEWEVFHLDEYNHFSAEFRRIARSMGKQAEEKNIDGAAMAYVQLTMSCVECHKFTRGVRMADAKPVKK